MVMAGQSDSFGVKNCAPPLGVTVMPALPATATAGSPSGEAATHGGGGTPVAGRREESSLALVRLDGTVANRRTWGYNTGSMSFLSELRQTLLPARDSKHGPLPPLLAPGEHPPWLRSINATPSVTRQDIVRSIGFPFARIMPSGTGRPQRYPSNEM